MKTKGVMNRTDFIAHPMLGAERILGTQMCSSLERTFESGAWFTCYPLTCCDLCLPDFHADGRSQLGLNKPLMDARLHVRHRFWWGEGEIKHQTCY